MASSTVSACWLILIYGSTFFVSGDPCLTANHQELGDLLKRSPNFAMDSVPLCDYYLTEGWYSAPSYLMPTSSPGLTSCGTLYPYWMKGALPSAVGDEVDVEICGVGFSSPCQKNFNIRVKKCTTFFVYKLSSLDSCNSAYCFENTDSCVKETPSNLEVVYQGVSYTNISNEHGIQWDPVIELRCQFTPLSDNTLYYHVDWYVDNTRIIENQTVDSSTLGKAILTTADLDSAGRKIGCSVHCVVGAKRTIEDSPCNSTSSTPFFAGIEVLTPVLNMSRKGETTLRVRPTIPYARQTIEFLAFDIDIDIGPLSISLDFPENIISDCTVAGSSRYCEIKIPSFKYSERHKYNDRSQWYKEYTMNIYNKDNIGYVIENSVLLRLKTKGGGEKAAKVYEEVLLPDVPINIVDGLTDWKGKYCYSHADPHMRTFDGYYYECQDVGCKTGITSVLYKNTQHDQEVQVRHHKCFWPNARCICALAVRSGKDVFIFDACNGRQYINFPICDDKSLKVVKVTDKSYKIFFPTGTYVTTTLYMYSDWFLQTQVYPSVADVGNSLGLCGVLGDGIQNDLTRRDGTIDNPNNFDYPNPPNDFSISWRVLTGDDLLSASMDFQSLNSLSLIKTQLCTCNQNRQTECSYRSYTNCGTTTRGKEYECLLHSSNSRRKRHAEYMASFKPDPVENSAPRRIRRQAAYTDEEVTAICNAEFDMSITFQTCIEHVADFSNDSIQNCIADVSLTGNPNLTSFHLESAISECQTFINLNNTLQEEKPVLTYEILSVCPNNCSDHGECSEGNCTCNTGFGGSDCSFDITLPPTVTSLLGNGLCDISEDTCNDVTMFGHFFLENMNTTCFMTRNEISVTNNVIGQKIYETRLEERTLYEGFCRLFYETSNTWVTQFVFNMSNDKRSYTNTFNVFVYQSECQFVNNDTDKMYFTLQNGFCFIDGKCIREDAFISNDSCSKCDPRVNKYNWTNDCDNGTYNSSVNFTSLTTTASKTVSSSTLQSSSTTESSKASLTSKTADQTTVLLSTPADATTSSTLTSSTPKQITNKSSPVPLASTKTSSGTVQFSSTIESSKASSTSTTADQTTVLLSTPPDATTSSTLTSSITEQITTKSSPAPLASTKISSNTLQFSSTTEPSKASFTSATAALTRLVSSTSPNATSSTRMMSSTAEQITTTSSQVSLVSTTIKATQNKKSKSEDEISTGTIALIAAVAIATLAILAVSTYMIKTKLNKKKEQISSLTADQMQDEVNIYPDTKNINPKDVFQGENLLKFDSPSAMYSRPPSAHSMRPGPPTVDLSNLYGPEKLDKLFGVQK